MPTAPANSDCQPAKVLPVLYVTTTVFGVGARHLVDVDVAGAVVDVVAVLLLVGRVLEVGARDRHAVGPHRGRVDVVGDRLDRRRRERRHAGEHRARHRRRRCRSARRRGTPAACVSSCAIHVPHDEPEHCPSQSKQSGSCSAPITSVPPSGPVPVNDVGGLAELEPTALLLRAAAGGERRAASAVSNGDRAEETSSHTSYSADSPGRMKRDSVATVSRGAATAASS